MIQRVATLEKETVSKPDVNAPVDLKKVETEKVNPD